MRKLVRFGEMLPSPLCCVTAQAPEHDPTRERSHDYGIVRRDSGAGVDSHTARLVPRELYSVNRDGGTEYSEHRRHALMTGLPTASYQTSLLRCRPHTVRGLLDQHHYCLWLRNINR